MDTPENPRKEFRGRPGKYPGSPTTVRVRIPAGLEEYVYWCITELPEIYKDYVLASRSTRDWTAFRRFVESVRINQTRHLNALIVNGEIDSTTGYGPNGENLVFRCNPSQDSD